MKCFKCGGEFVPPKNKTVTLKECPFCHTPIFNDEVVRGLYDFADFLQYIVSIYGKEIYKDKYKLANLIADLYVGEEKIKRVYRRAVLEDAVSSRIYNISLKSSEERRLFYHQLITSFIDENFYEQDFGKQVIDCFAQGISLDLKREIDKLIEKAESGDVEAQVKLGTRYYDGQDANQNYKEAVKWLHKAAGQGNADAQYRLAVCYEYGRGVVVDYKQAATWYRKSAEQGHASAQNNLGDCYYFGRGLDQNYKQAAAWYRKAAEQENAIAQYNLGICYENGEGVEDDWEEKLKWYKKSAEQGYVEAQVALANWYYITDRDDKEMLKWYKKAAEQGSAEASNALGNYYLEDEEEAVKWFRKSAELGNAEGLKELGLCYEQGTGVPIDYTKAATLLKKSAELGNINAKYHFGRCHEFGNGVEQNIQKAMQWYQEAAKQGDFQAKKILEHKEIVKNANLGDLDAQNRLGRHYFYEKKYHDAIVWFKKSAEQGCTEAQYYLGLCYREGKGTKQNIQKAILWYRKAAKTHKTSQLELNYINLAKLANRGSTTKQYLLGRCCLLGKFVPKCYLRAIKWLKKSANQKNVKAQCLLAVCYIKGYGVEKNVKEAARWYVEAQKQSTIQAQKK